MQAPAGERTLMGSFAASNLATITDALLACTLAELDATPAGAPEWSAVVTGADMIPEACHCGQLSIHVPLLYPSDRFPEPVTAPRGNCDAKFTVAELVVTVLRCQSQLDEQGRPPAAAAMHAAAQVDFADRQAMQVAATCCFGLSPPSMLGQHLAVGEAGACAGSALHVFVAMSNCEAC